MKQVIQAYKSNEGEKRIAVLKLEIDYELATLHDAILANDQRTIEECKRRLEQLRLELVRLEVLI